MKTLLLFVSLLAGTSSAYCDAIKYRQPNGQILITNQSAGEGAKAVTVHRAEYISPSQQQNAVNALQRQKEFLKERESENQVLTASSVSYSNSQTRSTTEQLHACLRSITASSGLSPAQEASRKVSCYRGTVGLNDECQRAIAATSRLSNQDEANYKRMCPN